MTDLIRSQGKSTDSTEVLTLYKKNLARLDSLRRENTTKKVQEIERFYKVALQKQDSLWLAAAYYYKADIEKDSALTYLNKARLFVQNTYDSVLMGRIEYDIGNYYLSKRNYRQSLEHLLSAENLLLHKKHLNGLGHANNMLGNVYYGMQEYDKALSYFDQAENYFRQIKDTLGVAISLSNRSKVLLKEKKYDLARKDLLSALSVFENSGDTTKIILALIFLGDTELHAKNKEASLNYTDQAYKMALRSKDTILEKHILLHYGHIYENYEDYDKAIRFYEEGVEKGTNATIDLESFQNLASLWVQKGEYQKAYKYMEQYYLLSDSIKGAEVKSQMEELQWKHRLQDQYLKNQLLQQETNMEQQKYKNRFAIYSILTISIISVLTLLYFNNKKSLRIVKLDNNNLSTKIEFEKELNKLQQKEFNEELALRSRELNAINIQLLAKNKLFSEVRRVLENSEKYEDINTMTRELWFQVDKLDNQEKDWEQFKEVFERIHPTFFHIIEEKAPSLTKTEIRICAYIKINMENSEIATLLNIGHRSLITNRSRIRKKLNLDRSESLEEILKSW